MKQWKLPFVALILIGLLILSACSSSETPSIDTETPQQESTSLPEPTVQLFTPEPSHTLEVTVEPQTLPTESSALRGQIAYVYNGGVWRYNLEREMSTQISTPGLEAYIYNLKLSNDGTLLAYNRDSIMYVHHLIDGSEQILADVGQFVSWTDPEGQFFSVRGEGRCEDIFDNLEDQVLINYDVLRVDLFGLEEMQTMANVSGGLRFPQAITADGSWISFLSCWCYSECSGHSLWHIPSGIELNHPEVGVLAGPFSFSPDFKFITFSHSQGLGYEPSPLFVSDVNFSITSTIFDYPGIYPEHPLWSPRGDWIAFNALGFDSEGMRAENRQVIMIKPDGSEQIVVEESGGEVVDWSPGGDQLLYFLQDGGSVSILVYDLATANKIILPLAADRGAMDWGNLP